MSAPPFFDKISLYSNNPQISNRLRNDGIVLLNQIEIFEYIEDTLPASVTRGRRSVLPEPTKNNPAPHINFIKHLLLSFYKKLAIDICGSIGEEYGITSATNSLTDPNFDILIAAKSDYKNKLINMSTAKEMMQQKIDNMLGFIIVEKGECPKYSDAYTINLICTRPRLMKGSILMGAYLYMIKEHPDISQVGLLELANGYTNLAGVCLYNKFGFDKDIHIFDEVDCFNDKGNLPMSVFLGKGTDPLFNNFITDMSSSDFDKNNQELTIDDIVNIVVNNKPIARIVRFKPVDLCGDLLPVRGTSNFDEQIEMQFSIAEKYNDIYKLEVTPNSDIDKIQLLMDESVKQKQNMDILKKNPTMKRIPDPPPVSIPVHTQSNNSSIWNLGGWMNLFGYRGGSLSPRRIISSPEIVQTGRGRRKRTKKQKHSNKKKVSKSKKYRHKK
jgi:hypothetical protein